jgi:subtilisin family serine protease
MTKAHATIVSAAALLATCGLAHAQIQMGDRIPHQFVTRTAAGIDIADIQGRHGLLLARAYDAERVYVLEAPEGSDDEFELAELEGDSDLESVEPNRYIGGPEGNTQSFFMNSVPMLIETQPVVPFLGLGNAHSVTDGTGITIAILDTGTTSNPRFAARMITGGYDFVLEGSGSGEVAQGVDTNGNGVTDQLFGHGTFVAGLVNLVAPGASILPIRVLDSDGVGSSYTVASGIYHAIQQGANVINLSLATPEKDEVIEIAIQAAEAAGIVVIASTGNDNDQRKHYPAAHPTVLSVTATDITDVKAPFSNYGSYVEMSAPGVDIVSTMPDGTFATASGTSFSAAFVTGTAALARSAFPTELATQIRARLITRGPSIDDLNPGYQGKVGHVRVAPSYVVQSCIADFNGDAFLDFADFDAFVLAFEAGAASSDVNMDGFLEFSDFDTFVAAFEAGC